MATEEYKLRDLENRIQGLFKEKYKDRVGLDLTVRAYRMLMGIVNVSNTPEPLPILIIQFRYKTSEIGPSFSYYLDTHKIEIMMHGTVLFDSRSSGEYHTINTKDMTENQKAKLTGQIRRECNRVFLKRSRSHSKGGKRCRTQRNKINKIFKE